jgi:hypothetical protein
MADDLKNWRSRRLRACRAADEFDSIINALGLEDGSELPPEYGLPTISEAHRHELRNAAALLLRMVLVANDGHISPAKLQRW